MTYLLHFLAGCVFACTGAAAQGWCRHRWHIPHRIALGAVLVALETLVVVGAVG